jgi:NitT/TauT family transport system ATP-binding protein
MKHVYDKAEVLLDIQHVGLIYGDRVILRDVNAQIYNVVRPEITQGQVIGFLGPSGIGKTQLSRIIAGLLQPTTGQVLLGEKKVPTCKGLVGMVSQSYTLFDFMTVQGNLVISAAQAKLGLDEAKAKIAGYVQILGLGDYLKLYPKQLSGGTRQRVAIAQQLICSEHFLIMDEPFSGLDLIMKKKACELITKVACMSELSTIIVVTHDVTEAASISDTLWMMGHEFVDGRYQPGAKLVESYDLADMGLAWRPDIHEQSDFLDFVAHVKQRFEALKAF